MFLRRLARPQTFTLTLIMAAVLFLVACGSSATTAPEQDEPTAEAMAPTATTAAPAPRAGETSEAPAPTAEPAPATEPSGWIGVAPGGKHGGVLQAYHVGNPGVWDPHRSPSGASMAAISKSYNQVLQWNPIKAGEIIGDLAKDWEGQDGGTTFIFHINDDIRWWDGEELTASDVAWSFNRMIEPEGA